MRILVALGGNALLTRGEAPSFANQRRNVARAAEALVPLAAGHELILTHGSGPQVGLLALMHEAYDAALGYPLDALDAEVEGLVGHLLELELRNRLPAGREVATLLTEIEVAADDPAMSAPAKPVGPVYRPEEGRRLAAERGWRMAADGDGLRRIVPSPRPLAVPGLAAIRRLVEAGVVTICAGGGGIPVARRPDGRLDGVEAVIDKDHASGLLARQLGCAAFLMLTDVDAVYLDWQGARARPLAAAAPAALGALDLPAGSMGPKAEAAADFVAATGGLAAIGRLEDAARLLAGTAGTRISPEAAGLVER